jgi:hypothetical protein
MGFWSSESSKKTTFGRSIASANILLDEQTDNKKILKMKNTVWNKIINTNQFDQFSDTEYVRWLEIYKDSLHAHASLNPVSIEQRMALIEILNAEIIQNDKKEINDFKIKKIKKHFERLDLKSSEARKIFENYSSDLFIILKNPPKALLDYYTKNKSEKMNKSLLGVLQEDMLLIGLKGLHYRIPEKDNSQNFIHGVALVKEMFHHEKWQNVMTDENLEWFKSLNLPDALVENILVGGLNEHDHDVITHLKNNNMIDQYERFRKVFRPLSHLFGTYYYYEKFHKTDASDFNQMAFLIKDLN